MSSPYVKMYWLIVALTFIASFSLLFQYKFYNNTMNVNRNVDAPLMIIGTRDPPSNTAYINYPICSVPVLNGIDTTSFINQTGYWTYHKTSDCSNPLYSLHEDIDDENKLMNGINCLGQTQYDSFVDRNVSYRRNECIFKSYDRDSESDTIIDCLSKHKSILMIGDSTSWELKNRIDLHHIKKRHHKHNVNIEVTLGTSLYENHSEWIDKINPNNSFRLGFVTQSRLRRIGYISHLRKEWIVEILQKIMKYEKFWIMNQRRENNVQINRLNVGIVFNRALEEYNFTYGDEHFVEKLMAHIEREKAMQYEQLHKYNAETVIFSSTPMHEIDFWNTIGWTLENKLNDSFSFDWREFKHEILHSLVQMIRATPSVKNIYFWTSYMGNTVTCPENGDGRPQWTLFNRENIKILNEMNLNIKYIDTGDVGYSYPKGWMTRYSSGCHYSGHGTNGLLALAAQRIVLNALCNDVSYIFIAFLHLSPIKKKKKKK
eukprot:504664_1